MKIADFKLEHWLNPLDPLAKYNIGASCVKALHLDEFFELIGGDVDEFYKEELKSISLHYGHFFGLERLLVAISNLYKDVKPEEVITVHGGTGANNMVINELVKPTDNVIAFLPNYQQHYSIPESLGAEVRYLTLKPENDYLPDLDELRSIVDENTKLITLSNPNNPTGSFIDKDMLEGMVEIAESVGAYILSDEIYRGLSDDYMTSIADIYDKGIVTSSMSKVFSMAGTRVGWIVTKEKELYDRLINRRSYDTICLGPVDELIAAIALENVDIILERSKSIVRTNRQIFDDWIKDKPHLSTPKDSLSTTAFITYDYDVEAEALAKDLFDKKSVLVCHGACFEIPKSFRLGYGFGRPDHFKECLGQLDEYLNTLE